jgi:uncharacterized membrane protein YhaH (DUF805 family)
MNYWAECWKKYAVFSGRARRKEYWMFVLINVLIGLAIGVVLGIVGAAQAADGLSTLYSLAAFLPGLAVTCRRLHDTGRSGWWFLLVFLPIVGSIVLIVFLCLDGQPGENAYGPNPKEA